MKTKHTPGPWQINTWNPTQVCDTDGENRGCAPIAYMSGTQAEMVANAALIAAAPELFAALELCRARLRSASYKDDATTYALERASAAITRATGA
jgi:hypothetical protein